jgi:ACS family hexuronate transporter-like MFS transporter
MSNHHQESQSLPSTPGGGNLSMRLIMICALLPLASAINYMDRQTLASAADRITTELEMSKTEYGWVEGTFGYGFVIGALIFGIIADKFSVRWVYPLVLTCWSLVTALTANATNFEELAALRFLLGVFEAGHWPCGIRVVRAVVSARGRTMGNGLLQSGTSVGAVATPLIILSMLSDADGSWRPAFRIIGFAGLAWTVIWFLVVRKDDFPVVKSRNAADSRDRDNLFRLMTQRNMLVIYAVVALINTCWQLLRAWLVLFLQQGRGYSERDALVFNSVWFAATEVGCFGTGLAVLWLVRHRISLHSARVIAFAGCATMCGMLALVPSLPAGPPLLAVLLMSGAGALGLFPLYHAFTQEISAAHQGKVTGFASVAAWFMVPPAQALFGRLVDYSGSYDAGLAAAGLMPVVAAAILWACWDHSAETAMETVAASPTT